jgi:predicted PhzF superfamily epimerase YddE/YHI9
VSRHCYVLSVFTRDGAGGNPLGVVTDVTDLAEADMQAIAAELGYAESVFIDWRDGGTPRVRIFTPLREMPFAGHPLVGTAWLLMNLGPGGPDRVETQVGTIPFQVEDGLTWITVPGSQPVSPLEGGDAWLVEMPLKYQVTRLASPAEVASLDPGLPAGIADFYYWAWDPEAAARTVRARFFSPDGGITEDAATGSAAVALAAVLRHEGEAAGALTIHQGEEMGSPSRIELRWDGSSTRVGGAVTRSEVRLLEV